MTQIRRTPEPILMPAGFSFASLPAGIKVSGRPDLALVEAADSNAAALFTKNRVVAAPVEVGRASLWRSGGHVRVLIVNSGNANCATGPEGRRACKRICRETGKLLGAKPTEVFPSSTGIIGVPFPVERVLAKLPELIASKSQSETAAQGFADAIMTTDTRPKIASARFETAGKTVTVLGIAKGSGMIHPNLATMLVYLFTDIVASARDLRFLLREACDQSFNSMSVDGDTSTNDTVLLLASQRSGVSLGKGNGRKRFAGALNAACQSLAEQIVSDGEGAQHVIRLFIEQAGSQEEARQVARAIAHSALVKTAWAGADPNWGRILAAAGYSGVQLDPGKIRIHIADQMVCRHGEAHPFDEKRAHDALAQPECDVRVLLGRGKSSIRFLTTDLTAEYVRINADYST